MGLAAFSALRDEHSPDTLPVSHWEIENAIGPEYVPGPSPDPAELLSQ